MIHSLAHKNESIITFMAWRNSTAIENAASLIEVQSIDIRQVPRNEWPPVLAAGTVLLADELSRGLPSGQHDRK